MQRMNVVIGSSDSHAATELAASLNAHFRSVAVAGSLDEIRRAIPKHRAQLAVVDLELASVDDIERLVKEFGTSVVATHRIPDEEMWASALAAGAIDCCQNADVAGIVDSVSRNVRLARSNAA